MRTALLIAALACSGCASTNASGGNTNGSGGNGKALYDRLGGKPAIEAVVDEFLARVSQDERINASFAGSHLPRLRQRLVELVCKGTGGPCTYSGRDMKSVHAGMGITGAQ